MLSETQIPNVGLLNEIIVQNAKKPRLIANKNMSNFNHTYLLCASQNYLYI